MVVATQQQDVDIIEQMRDRWRKIARMHNTDTGNAEAFAFLFGDEIKYDHRQRRWLIWQAPLWKPDSDKAILRKAQEMIETRGAAIMYAPSGKRKESLRWVVKSESNFAKECLLKLATSDKRVADSGNGWDENDWILGCENGIVDLKTGELRYGEPQDRVTISTGLNFDANAQCPRWMQFLKEVFVDDQLIDFVWRAVGYSLTGATNEEVLFVCYGTGANGKSKFVNRLHDLLGGYAWHSAFSAFEALERHAGVANSEIAALAGMRCVTASETRESSSLDEATIKALTGGEAVTARYLYSQPFVFEPKMKIWLSVNHRPKVADDSYGFWRRIRLIPFTQTFKGKAQDKDLEKKLRAEAQGILAWAVRGCLEWQQHGLEPPQSVMDATEQYKSVADTLSEFIRLYCVQQKTASVYARDLYEAYCEFCADIGEKPSSGTGFGRRITEMGFQRERDTNATSRKLVYRGIGLKV